MHAIDAYQQDAADVVTFIQVSGILSSSNHRGG
jgi:hypothetical protein